MRSLFALSAGDIVYESFTDTINESVIKQLFLILYLLTFYTSIQNIFVSIIMEGYDRCTLRKEIDNDDPFPEFKNLEDSIRKDSLNHSVVSELSEASFLSEMETETDPTQTSKAFGRKVDRKE